MTVQEEINRNIAAIIAAIKAMPEVAAIEIEIGDWREEKLYDVRLRITFKDDSEQIVAELF